MMIDSIDDRFNYAKSVTVNEPILAVANNHDCSLIAIVVRSSLRVYELNEDEGFKTRSKYSAAQQKGPGNKNCSSTTVAFCTGDRSSLVAVGATNGQVFIWDLEQANYYRCMNKISVHSRHIARVLFHPNNGNLLLTASRDNYCKLVDVRVNNAREAVLEVDCKNQLYDAAFVPSFSSIGICDGNSFACSTEYGMIHLYDCRMIDANNPNHSLLTIKAFNQSPAYSIDFMCYGNQPNRKCIAVGGGKIPREYKIRLYDITSHYSNIQSVNIEHENVTDIQSISPVSLVKWLPPVANQSVRTRILACSNTTEQNVIHCWDPQRPSVPSFTFDHCSRQCNGIARCKSNTKFVSCSADGSLRLHSLLESSTQPGHELPVAMAYHPFGNITSAVRNNVPHQSASDEKLGMFGKMSTIIFQNVTPSDNWYLSVISHFSFDPPSSSSITTAMTDHNPFSDLDESLCMSWFIKSALNYKIMSNNSWQNFGEACVFNAGVAESLGRFQIAQSWRILKCLFCPHKLQNDQSVPELISSTRNIRPENNGGSSDDIMMSSNGSDVDDGSDEDEGGVDIHDNRKEFDKVEDKDAELQGDSFFGECYGQTVIQDLEERLSTVGVSECGICVSDQVICDHLINNQTSQVRVRNWGDNETLIPFDSFDGLDPAINKIGKNNGQTTNGFHGDINALSRSLGSAEKDKRHSLPHQPLLTVNLSNQTAPSFKPKWQPNDLIDPLLRYYASRYDFQMCCVILMLLPKQFDINQIISQVDQEMWFLEYLGLLTLFCIELLKRFQLFTVAAEITKSCKLLNISNGCLIGTLFKISCPHCKKPFATDGTKKMFLCKSCRNITTKCSVCDQVVRGLYIWCNVCNHGGHGEHLKSWFKTKEQCPTGCGHQCVKHDSKSKVTSQSINSSFHWSRNQSCLAYY